MTSLVEAFYKLKQSPFSIDGEGRPLFMIESLRDAAEFVRSKLEDGAATLCVSSATGHGKSSLARALPKLTGGAWHIATLSGRTQSWDDMRPLLIREFGITGERVARDALAQASEAHGNLACALYTARTEVVEILQEFGVNVPFTEALIDSSTKAGEKNAAAPTSPTEGDVAQVTSKQPGPKSATVVGAKRLLGNFAQNVAP